ELGVGRLEISEKFGWLARSRAQCGFSNDFDRHPSCPGASIHAHSIFASVSIIDLTCAIAFESRAPNHDRIRVHRQSTSRLTATSAERSRGIRIHRVGCFDLKGESPARRAKTLCARRDIEKDDMVSFREPR